MKIGIFSDTHLGFDEKGERKEESFNNLKQAISLCLENDADAILLSGDIFDAPVPSHTVLYKSMECFDFSKKKESNVKLIVEKNGESKEQSFSGIPIMTIHGNHEFRGKDTKTAIEVLDLSGYLVYFHACRIVIQKDDEKVFVYGLGAVPEKKALEVLNYWNPKPEPNAVNLMLLHQSIKEFMAIEDEMVATISLSDLPKGFDVIVNGHLHWSNIQELGKTKFLLAGSTIPTSIKKLETEKPKGVYLFDSNSKELSFFPLPNQRKMFYHKEKMDYASPEQVIALCEKLIGKDISEKHEFKPLIRINFKGTLKKGISHSDINLNPVLEKHSSHALLSISKNFSNVAFRKKISELRDMQKEKLSVASAGFELLQKNLDETDFGKGIDIRELFDLLSDDNLDDALGLFSKE